ncbi:hypothetical protein SAMN04244553_3466 [Nocardia amikacinitolerans]|uniref:GDSL-like Lipase/Acylhydrolase family protein n=1 Tax=Nocardia amikacinitolerans TaxID=756689 RepID=A0A285LE89_9NOCA|nr:diglucosylglycerate octanoyltransferase [Nocardia amikacinitolerans]SNY82773.1 hypothetical protein SAMN04244553_3466 [Nocardia amikacinitolerans]
MSSEEPIRSVPDELFQQVTAKPERRLPDALFGGPAAEPAPPAKSAAKGDEPLRTVPDELFKQVTAKPERQLPDALFGGPPPEKDVEGAAGSADGGEPGGDAAEPGGEDDAESDRETGAVQNGASGTEVADGDSGSVTGAGVVSDQVRRGVEDDSATPDPADTPTEVAAGESVPSVEEDDIATSAPASAPAASNSADAQGRAAESALTGESAPVDPATSDAAATVAVSAPQAPAASAAVSAPAAVDEPTPSTASVSALIPSAAPVSDTSELAAEVVGEGASAETAGEVVPAPEEVPAKRPVLLVIADSLSYFGPKGGLPADDPRIWPNLVGAELDWDVELVGRIGWTCRDAYWALIGDPRVWAAVPNAGAVVFAVGGMDTLPSPLPTALRELIRYVRPPGLRRRVRSVYNWLQPKLSKLGRPVALPPKVSVDYLEQSREALAQLRPDLPFVAVLPSVHNCEAYGRVHSGRPRAVKALQAWSERSSVPLVDLGEAVRENIFSGDANPDGIHWGWAGHTAVANAMVKTLQEVR